MAEGDEEFLRKCVEIDPMVLEEEFVRIPSDLAYWNQRYSDVYQYWLDRKLITEQVVAQRSNSIRTKLEVERDGKRVTIAEVDRELQLDEAFQQAKAKQIAAEGEKVRLAGICEAIRAKKEMVISLGAHIRAEMGHDPLIRNQSYVDEEVRRARERG